MPIDNITVQLKEGVPEIALHENGPFELWGLLFVPRHSPSGIVYEFTAGLRNLWIRIQPVHNRCIIQNSWHKFLHGSNYTDFTISDINETAGLLSEQFQVNIYEAIIRKIECGCNIQVPDCTAALNRMISFKAKDFQPMVAKNKRYGMVCDCSQYKIKTYNKSVQVKLVDKINIPPNLMRWELAVKKMAFLHDRKSPIPVFKVSDLTEPDKLEYLCAETADKYRQSLKAYQPDLANYSLSEITSFARQENTLVRDIIKGRTKPTYQRDRRAYKKLLKDSGAGEDRIGSLLTEKFAELINK